MSNLREINLLKSYPKISGERVKVAAKRGIAQKLVASQRNYDYFDGDRRFGYGGLKQDNRWDPVARDICNEYGLDAQSSILQVNCEKGFLLDSFYNTTFSKRLYGTESSEYAIDHTFSKYNYKIVKSALAPLPFADNSMNLVISLGNVYTLGLLEAYHHLKEIERVKNTFSFITLATYANKEDYWLFKKWSLLANLILSKEEWIDLMNEAGYTGDFCFIDANYLGLNQEIIN